jgi:hypothetical protein
MPPSGGRLPLCGGRGLFHTAVIFISGGRLPLCGGRGLFHRAVIFISGGRLPLCGGRGLFHTAVIFISGGRGFSHPGRNRKKMNNSSNSQYPFQFCDLRIPEIYCILFFFGIGKVGNNKGKAAGKFFYVYLEFEVV